MLSTSMKSIHTHRDLLIAWTMRIIRARYQQSVLGGLWAVLQPAATVIVFSIIFTQFVKIDTQVSYVLFSFAAMVPWTFFTTSLSDMVSSLVDNMNLVTKVYFPREILPIAALLSRFVDFLIAGLMLVLLMIYFRTRIYLPALLFLPLVILVQMGLALGLGLIGAGLNVFYRDVKHLITLVLQLWFYASPIIYPMAGIIKAYRDVLLNGQIPDSTLLLSASVAVLVLAIGYWFFKRVEFQFADVV
jgi:lipopolysaccharide transport system permease protein